MKLSKDIIKVKIYNKTDLFSRKHKQKIIQVYSGNKTK